MNKVIIAGCRGFNNTSMAFERISYYLKNMEQVIIINGGASGADAIGKAWAGANNMTVVTYDADWKTYGKRAGPIRNKIMADFATHLILFWDGKSKGSKNMLFNAKLHGLKIVVLDVITGCPRPV